MINKIYLLLYPVISILFLLILIGNIQAQSQIRILHFTIFIILGIFFSILTFLKEPYFKNSIPKTLLAFIILVFMIHSFYFIPFTVDDAFISFQYAKNLASGNGLTFNNGEKVEGYTNFLLVIMEALFFILGLKIILWVKLVSILAGGIIIILMYRIICSEVGNNSTLNLLPCLVIALNSPFVLASTTGLETQLFTLAFFSGLYLFLKSISSSGKIIACALLTLSILIRPEGLIILSIVGVFIFHKDYKSASKKDSISIIVTFLTIFVPYFLWRYAYFGEFLPNTFHAKVGGDLVLRMIEGKKYIVAFLKTFGLRVFLFILIIQFFRNRFSKTGKCFLLVILTYFLYIAYTGKDWIPQFRFIAPVIPILFSMSYIGAYTLVKDIKLSLSPKIIMFMKIVLVIHLAFFTSRTISLKNTSKIYNHTMMRAAGYEQAHKRLALWLKENTPGDSAIAMMDVGIVKFYSERYIIDITGLTDKFIARSKGGLLDKDYDLSYIFDKKPDYIVLVTLKDLKTHPFTSLRSIDTRIYNDSRFKENYKFLIDYDHFYKAKDKEKGYYLNVFGRNN